MPRDSSTGAEGAAQKNIESFTRRADSFTHHSAGETIDHLREAARRIGFGPGSWAADFGVGTGNSALPFLETGGRVLGLDITPAMVRTGKQRLADEGHAVNAHFILGLCERTPIRDSAMDCAVCRNVFHHFAAPDEVVREMARTVRPGGHVIVMDHCYPDDDDERHRTEEIDHIREPAMVRILSLKDFRAIYAENGLEVIAAEARERRVVFDQWVSGAGTDEKSVPLVRAGVERLRDEGGSWIAPEGEGERLTLLQLDAMVVGRKG